MLPASRLRIAQRDGESLELRLSLQQRARQLGGGSDLPVTRLITSSGATGLKRRGGAGVADFRHDEGAHGETHAFLDQP